MSLSHLCFSRSRFSVSASLNSGVERATSPNSLVAQNNTECFERRKERIRKLFQKAELSVSSYDTAWVAMVPSPHSPQSPCFPQCVKWLLDNQCHDGSWSLPHQSPLLLKDVLQSTLACLLALKKWGIGEEHIGKGVQFIELNIASAIDESLYSPIGFDIIFPGLLQYAGNLSLSLPVQLQTVNALFQKRDLELRRCHESQSKERSAYLAYVSEGIGELQDWKQVMKYQLKNGSLFNSPSTTAAALTHLQNSDCLDYLHLVLKKFGNAVPTFHPIEIYVNLSMVDNLERLGIARHFMEEIKYVLDETYRYWLQGMEEIFMDASTCAIAFRLLRKNGYDVSSDPLMKFFEEDCSFDLYNGRLKDIEAILELYRALEVVIHPEEAAFEKRNLWYKQFLEQKLSNGSLDASVLTRHIRQQVDDVLRFPSHADLGRIRNRRNIEQYNVDNTRVLKTSYWSSNLGNKDFQNLAVEDFNLCQSVHLEEFAQLQRWVKDNKLDKLKFARQKSAYCYFSAAATLSSPELSDARMSWAKNGVLTTVIDDFFDVGGSIEELENLIQVVEKWDENIRLDCCSEHVEIIFSALHSTICELGDKALAWQARCVTNHIVEIWLDLLNSMLREAEWAREMSVPTVDEYMTNGYVSFALGPIVLPALYFVGPKLSEEAVKHSELQKLFKLMSTCGRLLNDIQSFEVDTLTTATLRCLVWCRFSFSKFRKQLSLSNMSQRESKDGKLNAVSLNMIHGSKGQTKEAAIAEMRHLIDTRRRELLRLVLQRKDSVIPKVCKDLFWNMSQVLHLFYEKDDGFTAKEMSRSVDKIIFEPVSVRAL